MGLFENLRAVFTRDDRTVADEYNASVLLESYLNGSSLTKKQALELPIIKSSLNLIKNTVREIPIKLYKKDGDSIEETDDRREFLLNDETGDTLTASQMWDALIEDYFLKGSAFFYIKRNRNNIKSLHYVNIDEISAITNNEPIFKDYYINVRGINYYPHEFFKIQRDSRDGATGTGIIDENPLLLRTIYNSLKYENNLVETGGNKKGFIKSQKKLSKESMQALKDAWKKLYQTNSENVVILNDGLDFKESSNSSVELQLATQKELNDSQVARLFAIPIGLLTGASTKTTSAEDKQKFIDFCILPFLKTIENSLNRDLLLESEKGKYFFKFDVKDIQKGSLLERMQAYEIAKRNNFMLLDEIRRYENLPATGFKYMDIGLSSVIYDIEQDTVFVPNTGASFKLKELKNGGGVINDPDPNQGQ